MDNVIQLAAPVPARGMLGLWEWNSPELRETADVRVGDYEAEEKEHKT